MSAKINMRYKFLYFSSNEHRTKVSSSTVGRKTFGVCTVCLYVVHRTRFHVEHHSSAHVYLRLKTGETIDDIPGPILEELAALTKANSIEGCKLSSVAVIYTMWSNLKKTGAMVDGEVGFHNEKQVCYHLFRPRFESCRFEEYTRRKSPK